MLENGIALLALTGRLRHPLIVELACSLDALMGFLVMQIFRHRIHRDVRHARRGPARPAAPLMLFVFLLGPALASALLRWWCSRTRAVGAVNAVLSLVAVGAALGLWREVLAGRVPSPGPDDLCARMRCHAAGSA